MICALDATWYKRNIILLFMLVFSASLFAVFHCLYFYVLFRLKKNWNWNIGYIYVCIYIHVCIYFGIERTGTWNADESSFEDLFTFINEPYLGLLISLSIKIVSRLTSFFSLQSAHVGKPIINRLRERSSAAAWGKEPRRPLRLVRLWWLTPQAVLIARRSAWTQVFKRLLSTYPGRHE